jgi:hypothetical protein
MLNRISLLAAACVTASAGLFVANAQVQNQPVPQDRQVQPVPQPVPVIPPNDQRMQGNRDADNVKLPAGITAKNLNDDKSVNKAFKAIADDGISRTGFDNLVGKLVDQDRDRIKKSLDDAKLSTGDVDGQKNKRLVDVIGSLENQWKTKFNGKLDIDLDKTLTGDFVKIMTGEVSDPQQLVGKWPLNAGSFNTTAAPGKVTQSDADQAKNKMFGGDVNLEKGRNVAIAHLIGTGGMQGITASLIHESMGGYKFDIPNTVTGQRLYDNLVANLSFVDQHRDQLGSDINMANRHLVYAVTAALYDIKLSGNFTVDR